MDEIEIDVVELESLETGLEGGLDAFRTMIVVPELRGDKDFLSLDLPRLEHVLHRFADLLFISVAFGSVELAKPCLQRRLGRGFGRHGVGNQRAEAEGRNSTGSIVEGHLRIAKVVVLYHCFTSSAVWWCGWFVPFMELILVRVNPIRRRQVSHCRSAVYRRVGV